MLVNELKKAVSYEVYKKYLTEIKEKGHVECPFPEHDDQNPSFRISEKNGEYFWICSCGRGDCADFLQRINGYSFLEAKKELESIANVMPKDNYQKKTVQKKKEYDAKFLYSKSSLNNDDLDLIKKYFIGQRKIVGFSDDLIKRAKLKVNRYRDRISIVYPVVNIQKEIVQIGTIEVDRQGRKIGKKTLGIAEGDRCFYIEGKSGRAWICEGIEDAFTLMINKKESLSDSFIVTNSANNFNKLSNFLIHYKNKYLILDNDKNNTSIELSEVLCEHGVIRKINRHGEAKDANEALCKGILDKWLKELVTVEYKQVVKIINSNDKIERKLREFNIGWLPNKLCNYIKFLSERTDADDALLASSVISCASAFAKHNLFIPQGDFGFFQKLYCNLWFLNISTSGTFKSTSLNKGFAIAYEHDKSLIQQLKELKKDNSIKKEDLEIEERNITTKLTLFPPKITPEFMLDYLAAGHAGVMIFQEFGHYLKEFEKSHNLNLKGIFTDFYDVPEFYSYGTVGKGYKTCEHPYFSICAVSTVDTIKENLTKDDFKNGFANRFLFFFPQNLKNRYYPPALPDPSQKLKKYGDSKEVKIFKDVLASYENYFKSFKLNEIQKQYGDDLKEIYDYVYDRTNEAESDLIHPFLKRWLPAQLKLSMIFQTFTDDSDVISLQALESAKKVLYYAIDSTFHLINNEFEDSEHIKKRNKVLRYLEKKGGEVTWSELISSKQLQGGSKDYLYIVENLVEIEAIELREGSLKEGHRTNLKIKLKEAAK